MFADRPYMRHTYIGKVGRYTRILSYSPCGFQTKESPDEIHATKRKTYPKRIWEVPRIPCDEQQIRLFPSTTKQLIASTAVIRERSWARCMFNASVKCVDRSLLRCVGFQGYGIDFRSLDVKCILTIHNDYFQRQVIVLFCIILFIKKM